jgi:hypothetical protein
MTWQCNTSSGPTLHGTPSHQKAERKKIKNAGVRRDKRDDARPINPPRPVQSPRSVCLVSYSLWPPGLERPRQLHRWFRVDVARMARCFEAFVHVAPGCRAAYARSAYARGICREERCRLPASCLLPRVATQPNQPRAKAPTKQPRTLHDSAQRTKTAWKKFFRTRVLYNTVEFYSHYVLI